MRYDDRSLAGILFILGAVQFLLAMLVSEGSLPQYSVSTNAISDLGVGPTAALFNTSVAFLGLLSLGGVYFYHRTEKALWITIPFLLASIGPIGVGLFPERNSVSNALHGVFALISFLFGGLVAILVSVRVRAPFRYLGIILGIVGLSALILFTSGQYAGIGFGGMERMIAYPVLFWEIAFGAHLMSTPEPSGGPAATGETG